MKSLFDKFLKYWFIFSIVVSVIFAGWLFNFFIYKIFVNNLYINFSYLYYLKYSIYLFIFLSIYSTIKKKIYLRNIIFLILLGFFIHDVNFKNTNFKLEYNLKNNIVSYKIIDFLKKKIVSTNDEDLVFKLLNNELKTNILIRQDLIPGIFIYNHEDKSLIKVVENEGISTLLPFSIVKNKDDPGYNLIYFQNSYLTKTNLKNNFLDQNILWQKRFQTVFHHWGDIFDNKLYLMGSKTSAFPHPFQKLYNNNFHNCENGNFLNETIEIIDGKNGKLLNSFFILDIVSAVLPVNNKKFNLICNDPTHSNDVRVIKNQLHANFFPNGKIGDMLISLRHFNSIVLIDNETLELKWHLTGKSNWQHSPRITDSGTILIFDNLGSNPIYGLSRITSINIKTKEIVGIYEANSNKDYFSSKSGGRIQVYDDALFVNSTNEAKLFKLTCDNLDILRNCERQDVFELEKKSDLFFADLF